MTADAFNFDPSPGHAGRFATTRWSLIVSAGRTRSPETDQALAALCESYWFPLYAFVRRAGHTAEDAQDLTQEFFSRLLDQRVITKADRSKGKFRTFLLATLKHFLADQWDRTQARKRGGGRTILSFDAFDAETRYCLEPTSPELSPEKVFERQWAMAVLERVLAKLRKEMIDDDKAALFEALKSVLTGGNTSGYAAIGASLGTTEGAVKVAAHRMRRRYRELLRAEIAHTVTGPGEVEEELRSLLACFLS